MAAAAALLAARLDGAGYVVCLRHGQDAGLLAGAIGPGPAAAGGQVSRVAAAWADFDATEIGPGWCGSADRATLLVGELDNLDTERTGLLASHIPGRS
jgi:hypothetical protein